MAADPELVGLATQAYLYGYPMVFNLEQVRRFATKGMGALPRADFNTWAHGRGLASERDTFVSVNNDTVYSMAMVDLAVGPVFLRVPDTGGRYYVLQHVDAWTNNFAYIGRRATGTEAGTYVLVPPAWDGRLPDDATPIHCPTRVFAIVGRFACEGAHDLPAVASLQDQLVLEPVAGAVVGPGLPEPDVPVADNLVFWEQMRLWMLHFPPPAGERNMVDTFRPLGVLDGLSPYSGADPALVDALDAGVQAGKDLLEQLSRGGGGGGTPGAWSTPTHAFDYNNDFFQVGTINSDEWKIADPKRRFGTRAMAARVGLWGNHGYEAIYATTYNDSAGAKLSGASRYRLHFPATPPVDAFWSVTMYDDTDYFLVANAINRFTVGDRTPGLVYGDDGSLTITIQHDEPTDPGERANWLPAPEGGFRPMMRMYEPQDALFDGSYVLPPIERAG